MSPFTFTWLRDHSFTEEAARRQDALLGRRPTPWGREMQDAWPTADFNEVGRRGRIWGLVEGVNRLGGQVHVHFVKFCISKEQTRKHFYANQRSKLGNSGSSRGQVSKSSPGHRETLEAFVIMNVRVTHTCTR